MSFWDVRKSFQILPFYNALIEKPKIRHLSNIELLHELLFYDELSVVKKSNAFKGYSRSYKVETIEPKNTLVQLEASKSSIKDLKGFKYQITMIVLLYKHKMNGDTEYSPVYFNFTTKTVINSEYYLDTSFQEDN